MKRSGIGCFCLLLLTLGLGCETRVRDLDPSVPAPTMSVDANDAAFATGLGVVDTFDYPNGSASQSMRWLLDQGGYTFVDGQVALAAPSDSTLLWNMMAGTEQASQLSVVRVPATGELNLIYKAALSARMRHLDVTWDFGNGSVFVAVSDDQNVHSTVAGPVAVRFVDGDTVGARVDAAGQVLVYLNGKVVLNADVSAWPYHADGGYVGFRVYEDLAGRFDDFRIL